VRCLVTGGAGFIGSHLVKSLVSQGREVRVASDLSHLGTENLLDLGVKGRDIELFDSDLRDYRQAVRATEGVDTVFHLAARAGSLTFLHGSNSAELAALQENLVIDANIFRASIEKKVKKLIYTSSWVVYSMSSQFAPEVILSESSLEVKELSKSEEINPDGGYGWSKLMGEIELGWMKDIDISVARLFNIYGPNGAIGEKGHVVCDLIVKVISYPQREFVVHGDGKQTRDFLYVSDCVEALLALEKRATNPPITVNVGSGVPTSIGAIAEKVVRLSEKQIKIAYDVSKPAGPVSRTSDIAKAKALLSWQPRVSIDEGLRLTYNWVEKKLRCS